MSRTPVKKKSCFQITSVTQAQVAASGIPHHTAGSRDHLDEPRTKLCVETQNNAGESQDGQPPHTQPANSGLPYNASPGTDPVSRPSAPSSITSMAPPAVCMAHTSPMISNCSSRFRVIKLDHGTGEPFKRGRWTCTDFYERDSDSSRTMDRIKPALILNHTVERDSGLGSTGFSVITSSTFPMQVVVNTSDSGYSASVEHPSESLHKGSSLRPQTGSRVSAFQPPEHTVSVSQEPHHSQASVQPIAPQTFSSNSLNGVHQGAMQQKIPGVTPAAQPQQLGYSSHPEGHSYGHAHCHQRHFGSNTCNPPTTSLVMAPSSVITPGEQGERGEDDGLSLMLQGGNAPDVTPIASRSIQQQVASIAVSSTTTEPHTSGLNVSATVPNTISSPASVPSRTLGIEGLVQPQDGLGGATASFSEKTDGWKIDGLPQNCADVMAVKDDVKLFLSDDLGLSTPAANSHVGIHISMNADDDGTSTASVVAIDNKIEQAMDLVKSHLMYAVREEVEVLKEQIKELYERNSLLERENAVLKSLANSEQLNQLSGQVTHGSTSPPLQQQLQHGLVTSATALLAHQGGGQSIPHQHNVTSA